MYALLIAIEISVLFWERLQYLPGYLYNLDTCTYLIRPRLTLHTSTKHGYTAVLRVPMLFGIFYMICSLVAAGIRCADSWRHTALIDAAV